MRLNNPKLLCFISGLVCGATLSLLNSQYSQQTINEFRQIADAERQRYEQTIKSKSYEINMLEYELKQMKSAERRVVEKKADGSSIETFEKTVDQGSSRGVEAHKKAQEVAVTSALSTERSRTETESKITTTRLNLFVGRTWDGQFVLGADYPIWKMFTVHGQIGTSGLEAHALIGIGVIW